MEWKSNEPPTVYEDINEYIAAIIKQHEQDAYIKGYNDGYNNAISAKEKKYDK